MYKVIGDLFKHKGFKSYLWVVRDYSKYRIPQSQI